MIGFAPIFRCTDTPPPFAGEITLRFPGDLTAASMAASGTADIIVAYNAPGDPYDFLEIKVATPAYPAGQVWVFVPLSNPSTSTTGYSALDTGWYGAGTYTFTARVRRISSGAFDVVSNPITLTVTP